MLLIAAITQRYNRSLGGGYIWIPLSTGEPPNIYALHRLVSEMCSTLGVSVVCQRDLPAYLVMSLGQPRRMALRRLALS